MAFRVLVSMGLATAVVLCALVAGCGGETNIQVTMVGLYAGTMDGDGAGPLRFYIGPGGGLIGNFRLPPICNGPVHITGSVTPDGNVVFTGTGCGVTFQGTGHVERLAPGSNVWVGSGTWTGSNGTHGTWGATWIRRSGSISV